MISKRLDDSRPAQAGDTKDAITKQLLQIWQDLLGLESIGIDDNYFDLGGDSPLAVQLFAQIDKIFRVKLPLATLFEAPTIRELAQTVRRRAVTSAWSPLVPIQRSGSRPPFFCIHGAGGNVLIYRDLARRLGADQPFYGLQSCGLDGTCEPMTRIEDMAALYVEGIQKVQAHGPYFLGGYCLGGTIAYEAARRFEAMGEQVALLALFDTVNWGKGGLPSFWAKSYYAIQKLVFHTLNFLRLNFAGQRRFFLEKMKILHSRLPVWRGMLLRKFIKSYAGTKSESAVLSRIWQANDEAALNYVAQPYSGTVTDFRPIRQYRMFNKPGLKWDGLAQGGQKIIVLSVYPAGMLVEPFIEHLSRSLNSAIEEAIRAYSAADSEQATVVSQTTA